MSEQPNLRENQPLLAFENVSFSYEKDKPILDKVSFQLFEGKTYALVGPTGGGKSTTASLLIGLLEPTDGKIYYKAKPINEYSSAEIAREIGFILQEPFLFNGNVLENIIYGNPEFEDPKNQNKEFLTEKLTEADLLHLIDFFPDKFDTKVESNALNISLGQRQLISFMRILLRKPKVLIMDEATANIDTLTESSLQKIISNLPPQTCKVVIAHRLNTISEADQIFFVGNGKLRPTENITQVRELLQNNRKNS